MHRGLQPAGTGPASRIMSIRLAQARPAVSGRGRRHRIGAVGAGSGDRHTGRADQSPGPPDGRAAHRHGRPARRSRCPAPKGSSADQRSGPGQKFAAEFFGNVRPGGDERFRIATIADVHDHRIVGRPALGVEDARHCRGIQGVGAKSVNGLSGKRHECPLRSSAADSSRIAWSGFSGSTRIMRVRNAGVIFSQ